MHKTLVTFLEMQPLLFQIIEMNGMTEHYYLLRKSKTILDIIQQCATKDMPFFMILLKKGLII